jgi:hypothetical protein
MTERRPDKHRVVNDQRFTRGVVSIALTGGFIGWVLVGDLWGCIGLWVVFTLGVLLAAAIAEALNVDGE